MVLEAHDFDHAFPSREKIFLTKTSEPLSLPLAIQASSVFYEHLRSIFEYSVSCCVCIMLRANKALPLLPPIHPSHTLCFNHSTLSLRVNNWQLFKAHKRHSRIMESQSRHLGCAPASIPDLVVPFSCCFTRSETFLQ